MNGLLSAHLNDIDICENYGLILKHISIEPPSAQTNFVKIPFRNGSVDLTESLTGDVKYNDRKIVIQTKYIGDNLLGVYSQMLNDIHGKRFHINFDEDAAYYYDGRVSLTGYTVTKYGGEINMEATCNPYKVSIESSSDWLWDPFDFEYGYINEFINMAVDGIVEVVVIADIQSQPLRVTTDSPMLISFGEERIEVGSGTHSLYFTNPLVEGENTIEVAGSGTITIDYRGGRL